MYKELIITIIIVVLVIVGDIFSQNFTEKSVNDMNISLEELRISITEEKDQEKSKYIISQIGEEWENKRNIMAYYLEHDELEKVSTQLYEIKGYIEVEQLDESIPYIHNCEFLLNHVKDKEEFNLKNIF